MSETIGELNKVEGRMKLEWQIKDFFSLLENKTKKLYRSSQFDFADASWYLQLDIHQITYPDDHSEYVGLYLMNRKIRNPLKLACKIGLKRADGKVEHKCNYIHTFEKEDEGLGCADFHLRSQFLSRKSLIAPSGMLIFSCDLTQDTLKDLEKIGDTCTQNEKKLIQDIKEMMLDETGSDIKVKIKDKIFYLHRSLLKVRAPTFSTIIKDKTTEIPTDVVHIEDIDSNIFKMFLDYIYTGLVNDLSENNVFDLYELAKKYEIEQLKEDCMDFIKRKLSTDTFFDVISLIEKYDEKELKTLTSLFLSDNLKELMKNKQWITFMKDNAEKAYEMITTALEFYEKITNKN